MTIASCFLAAIEDEAADLIGLATSLRRQTNSHQFDRLISQVEKLPGAAKSAWAAEAALESATQSLRRRWLDLANAETHRSYRSPTTDQTVQTPARLCENFGYERELQPTLLEDRCAAFFGPPPAGWRADHILFSSGQAAMTASLHLAEKLIPDSIRRPLTVIHAGAYFETAELLNMLPTRFKLVASGSDTLSRAWSGTDLILVEPVFYEERFTSVATTEIVERLGAESRPLFIFDDTLTGGASNTARDLVELEALMPRAIMRVISGLKLLQGGLELANVGIVSLYTSQQDADAAAIIRRLRALLGLGLRFSDVAGLEAPWFLDRDYTLRYSAAVFAHNKALASALSAASGSFASISHPSTDGAGGGAAFCVLHLDTADVADYEHFADRLRREGKRRNILFERRGSFGFRGHRYDVIAPANAAPFLRVAMGRRGGWSFRGVVDLLQEI